MEEKPAGTKEEKEKMPKDPYMLLSWVNTQLRDHYPSLAELAAGEVLDGDAILEKLHGVGYVYNPTLNRFVAG